MFMSRWYNALRSLVYPGLDLHLHSRAALRRYWFAGDRRVLDAGSGNGYFSWLAYRSGARVLALNIEATQVQRAQALLNNYRRADPERLRFQTFNLYDLNSLDETFDEIICFETLEHIRDDVGVCRQFFRLLRPGGVLHLCCPHELHSRHQAEVLDEHESGGHVRAGYTRETYVRLLEPIGFEIDRIVGVGTPAVFWSDYLLRSIRTRTSDLVALPLLPWLLPVVRCARLDPPMPFSLYCRAVKPVADEAHSQGAK
jgi:SAM-dependent methyltransferase